ncbi:MAG: hypothetical protein C0615_00600 [Desulfuromonas sp.]|nr:MAG: hypothetical protein C0615_00600 [Desulfuromonas sp.]
MNFPAIAKAIFLLFLSSWLASCSQATIPMKMVRYPQQKAEASEKNLLILLRGIGGSNESFEKYGLIDEIRKRDLPFDIVAPDAHFGYYRNESVQDRINEDIVQPARQTGYQKVWLAGFSMGGLGSLFYLERYAKHVDGVILVCPFVGWRSIIDEIRDAGGLAAWDETTSNENDWQRFIWSWIKNYSSHKEEYPPVYLGYGNNDLLTGSGPALLATALPEGRSFSVDGGHTYQTFRKIFLTHLDNLEFVLRKREVSSDQTTGAVQSSSR